MFLRGIINENLEPVVESIFLVGEEGNIPLNAIPVCVKRRETVRAGI